MNNEQVDTFKASPAFKANPAAANQAWAKADGKGKTVADVDKGAFDLQNYIANEFMGGYISLTRYGMIARSFACGMGGTVAKSGGWVYCCFAEGAFNVPRKGAHAWATKNEAELAMPGMLEWEDIVGFRQVTPTGMFSGPVYVRRSLYGREPKVFPEILAILSGKNQ